MCDYSLHHVASRPAKVGDQLTTRELRYRHAWVRCRGGCLRCGMRAARDRTGLCQTGRICNGRSVGLGPEAFENRMAIFRQVNKERAAAHHDALEFPDGTVILLTRLLEGQEAVVLQLPAQPTTASEAEAQKHVVHVG